MSSSSPSDCIGKLTGLFGLKLDEKAGSFLGDGSRDSSSGFFFFFPVFCLLGGLLCNGVVVSPCL